MASPKRQTIACFGATGGCVGSALAYALKEGHHCSALARNPDKLRTFLTTEHKVPEELMKEYLTIHEGDVKDAAAVAKALVSPTNSDAIVDVVLCGVGAYPAFQWSIRCPFPLTDPTICETTIASIYKALSNLSPIPEHYHFSRREKPLLIVISTAGCGRSRGIPLPIVWPYRYFLGSPLADKRQMEAMVFAGKGNYIRDFVIMRPLFLTDGDAREDSGLRVGWEWGVAQDAGSEREPGPELGYFVSRKDVGTWVFENVIVKGGWDSKCVYLTY
ncbi:Oxidase pynE [Paramyrothecium foliicola]|nr:Oxidase pynE [Paramyrothecium foliicola]